MPIGIEHEHLVVPLDISILFRREMNPSTKLQAPPVRVIDIRSRLDVEGQMLKPDLVIPMLTAICATQPEILISSPTER